MRFFIISTLMGGSAIAAAVLPTQEPKIIHNDTCYALQTRAAGWSFQPNYKGFETRVLGLSLVSRRPQSLELFVSSDHSAGTAHIFWTEGETGWGGEYFHAALNGPLDLDHPTGAIVGLSRQENNMEVFFVSAGKYVRSRYWQNGKGWKKSGEDKSTLLHYQASIAVTSMRPDTMELFWVAQFGGAVYHSYWNDNGKGWIKDQVLFGPNNGWATKNSIAAVSRTQNHQDVFWVTTSGYIQVASFDATNGWVKRELWGAKPHLSSRLAVNSPSVGQINVFYVGKDSRVYAMRWNQDRPSDWVVEKVSDLEADPGTVLTATSRASHLLEVFWLAKDGTVKHAYWDYVKRWRSEPLPGSNANTACLPGSDITTISRKNRDTIEGFCVSKQDPKRVHHFYYYG